MFRGLLIVIFTFTTTAYGKTINFNKDRLIEIIDVIDEETFIRVPGLIYQMSQTSKEPIYMMINSPGGEVVAGATVIDAMTTAQSTGIKFICGSGVMAASMAFSILAHCDERYTLKNTKLLFHPISMTGRVIFKHLRAELESEELEEDAFIDKLIETMGVERDFFMRHYMNETLWAAHVLKRYAPKFIEVVDNITGSSKLFTVIKPKPFLFFQGNQVTPKPALPIIPGSNRRGN